MKRILFISALVIISNIAFSQLITKQSNFEFVTPLVADSTGYIIDDNSITLINKGDQTATIDANFELATGEFIVLGGNESKQVRDTIDITFSGVGTKKLFVIKETVTAR